MGRPPFSAPLGCKSAQHSSLTTRQHSCSPLSEPLPGHHFCGRFRIMCSLLLCVSCTYRATRYWWCRVRIDAVLVNTMMAWFHGPGHIYGYLDSLVSSVWIVCSTFSFNPPVFSFRLPNLPLLLLTTPSSQRYPTDFHCRCSLVSSASVAASVTTLISAVHVVAILSGHVQMLR